MSRALLIMDVQNGVVERLRGERSNGLLERLATAASAARAHSIAVIYARLAFRDGGPEISARNRSFSSLASMADFGDQDAATQIHEAVKPQPGDVEILKKRTSAFTGSDLDVILRSKHISQLVLGGIATSGVVLSTVREAADRDFQLTVLSDGCADGDDEVHRILCEKIFPRQADVISVKEWITSLAS